MCDVNNRAIKTASLVRYSLNRWNVPNISMLFRAFRTTANPTCSWRTCIIKPTTLVGMTSVCCGHSFQQQLHQHPHLESTSLEQAYPPPIVPHLSPSDWAELHIIRVHFQTYSLTNAQSNAERDSHAVQASSKWKWTLLCENCVISEINRLPSVQSCTSCERHTDPSWWISCSMRTMPRNRRKRRVKIHALRWRKNRQSVWYSDNEVRTLLGSMWVHLCICMCRHFAEPIFCWPEVCLRVRSFLVSESFFLLVNIVKHGYKGTRPYWMFMITANNSVHWGLDQV